MQQEVLSSKRSKQRSLVDSTSLVMPEFKVSAGYRQYTPYITPRRETTAETADDERRTRKNDSPLRTRSITPASQDSWYLPRGHGIPEKTV